jgi:hypothetical protein
MTTYDWIKSFLKIMIRQSQIWKARELLIDKTSSIYLYVKLKALAS